MSRCQRCNKLFLFSKETNCPKCAEIIAEEARKAKETRKDKLAHKDANNTETAAKLHEEAERYFYGNGVVQDYDRAYKLYSQSAEMGYAAAESDLGFCYTYGYGTSVDYFKALEWFNKAVAQQYAPAMTAIGSMYEAGTGFEQNLAFAFKWYKNAAELGDKDGLNNVGVFYLTGKSVVTDHSEAAKWFQKAANKGHIGAAFNLGVQYMLGDGITTNIDEAKKWLTIAAEGGHPKASYVIDELTKRTHQTHSELSNCDKLVDNTYTFEQRQDIIKSYMNHSISEAEIIEAIENGYLSINDCYIAQGTKKTLVYLAIINRSYSLMNYLLKHGCNVNADIHETNGDTEIVYTCLAHAAKYNDVGLVKKLISHGADINAFVETITVATDCEYGKQSIIECAASRCHEAIIACLIENGANVNQETFTITSTNVGKAKDIYNRYSTSNRQFGSALLCTSTPLYNALINQKYNNAKLLIDAGADVDYIVKSNVASYTMLSYSIMNNDMTMFNLLITSDADPNIPRVANQNGASNPPLFDAVWLNNYDMAKRLLKAGADVNCCQERKDGKFTAYRQAYENGNNSIMELMRDYGYVTSDVRKANAEFDEGAKLERSNDPVLFQQAYSHFLKAAELGLAKAQTQVGYMLLNGHGIQKDISLGISWTVKAVQQGYPMAEANLAEQYRVGIGVPKDLNRAYQLFKRAAGHNDEYAKFVLSKWNVYSDQGLDITHQSTNQANVNKIHALFVDAFSQIQDTCKVCFNESSIDDAYSSILQPAIALKRNAQFVESTNAFIDIILSHKVITPNIARCWYKSMASAGDLTDAMLLLSYIILKINKPMCPVAQLLASDMLNVTSALTNRNELCEYLFSISGNKERYLKPVDIWYDSQYVAQFVNKLKNSN